VSPAAKFPVANPSRSEFQLRLSRIGKKGNTGELAILTES
jgi:hypothetical protein